MYFGWCGICLKDVKESNIIRSAELMGFKYSIIGGAMKITYSCLVLMKGKKCDGLYHLIRITIIDGISLTFMGSWKRCEENNKHLYKVSFIVGAEIIITSFQVADVTP